jgi:4-amino-4-deoxy-L-arabinose transferase-like glycosyltransferase
MKRKIIFLLCILVVAAVLRLWHIGSVPISLDWDEAALGYNAYSILHTGKDEYGKSFPIVLESFGDYKPALYTYLIIPLLPVFDLSAIAVRLPSAICGILAVLLTYFLVQELLEKRENSRNETRNYADIIALVAAFLLAISPWSIQFSRVAFETNVGMFLNLAGILFFLKGLKKPLLFTFSSVFFALSIYVYQSEKLFVPLILLILISVFWKKLLKISKVKISVAIAVLFVLVLPMMLFILTNKDALARAQGVSFFNEKNEILKQDILRVQRDKQDHDLLGQLLDNRRIVYAKTILQAYLSHYDLNWWFITGDATARHHAPGMGLLYWIEFPFLFAGLYFLFFGKTFPIEKKTKIFLLLWFLAAPLPASITTGVPHAVRTENFLPTFQIFTALGVVGAFLLVNRNYELRIMKHGIRYIIYACFLLMFLFNFGYYLNQYFIQLNYYNAADWIDWYQELVNYIKPIQSHYRKIIVSNSGYMDQSYIYFLFYLKYDPSRYLAEGGTKIGGVERSGNSFANFEFRKFTYADENETPVLLVGSDLDFPQVYKQVKEIVLPDKTVVMRVVEKK